MEIVFRFSEISPGSPAANWCVWIAVGDKGFAVKKV